MSRTLGAFRSGLAIDAKSRFRHALQPCLADRFLARLALPVDLPVHPVKSRFDLPQLDLKVDGERGGGSHPRLRVQTGRGVRFVTRSVDHLLVEIFSRVKATGDNSCFLSDQADPAANSVRWVGTTSSSSLLAHCDFLMLVAVSHALGKDAHFMHPNARVTEVRDADLRYRECSEMIASSHRPPEPVEDAQGRTQSRRSEAVARSGAVDLVGRLVRGRSRNFFQVSRPDCTSTEPCRPRVTKSEVLRERSATST